MFIRDINIYSTTVVMHINLLRAAGRGRGQGCEAWTRSQNRLEEVINIWSFCICDSMIISIYYMSYYMSILHSQYSMRKNWYLRDPSSSQLWSQYTVNSMMTVYMYFHNLGLKVGIYLCIHSSFATSSISNSFGLQKILAIITTYHSCYISSHCKDGSF